MGFKIESFDKKAILVFVVLITTLSLYYFLVTAPADKEFEKNARYTIATITKTKSPSRGSCVFYFNYQIRGKLYENQGFFSCNQEKLYMRGRKIFIKFSQKNPEKSYALENDLLFAPETIVPPDFGWEKLPRIKNRSK